MGASAAPTGLSQAEPEVSALRASIPSALFVQFSDCGKHIRRWSSEAFDGGDPYVAAGRKFAVTAEMEKAGVAHALSDTIHGSNGGWPGYVRRLWGAMNMARLNAQGIEAGTAETGTGSVHESPVPEGNAP